MESAAHAQRKAILCNGTTSPSFRLRCQSLNSVRLRRIFDMFDRNSDGMITVEELSEALNLLGLDTDFSEMESTVRSFIKPGNIGLRFEDFDALHRSLDDAFFGSPLDCDLNGDEAAESTSTSCAAQDEKDLTEAFKVFDEDGDGFISATELQIVLAKLGLQEEGKEIDRVEQMISSVDQNRDGRVDFFEFKDMMRSVMVRTS
nr:probable calcium-binding protein CML43 [Ipomoea batatas]